MEETDFKNEKENWQMPTIIVLKFNQTLGGPSAGSTEDDYENNPVTGS
jgi:hypothetical protein